MNYTKNNIFSANVPNSIHIQVFSWQDYAEQFKRLDTAYGLYPWVDTKDTYDPEVIKREHDEFVQRNPSVAKDYNRVPDIRFDYEELLKQVKGKRVKSEFPFIPIV